MENTSGRPVDGAGDPGGDEGGGDLARVVRRSLITGTAIIIPAAVTLLVIGFVLNFLSNTLDPVATVIQQSPFMAETTSSVLIKLVSVVTFLAVVFGLGFLAEYSDRGDRLGDQFDELMASIPGLGSVYRSFDEMSEMLLDSDTESFQDVKLIEYPGEGSYVVAFKTSDTPRALEEETGHEEMVTLFMPMAPNPVMGGFVVHVDRSRVVDVDMTVEQGIQSIVTSGVAFGGDGPELQGLTAGELRELGRAERVEGAAVPGAGAGAGTDDQGDGDGSADRVARYDAAVSPEYSETPRKIVERARQEPAQDDAGEGTGAETGTVAEPPAEAAGRAADRREPTGTAPAKLAGREDDEDGREATAEPPGDRRRDPASGDGGEGDGNGEGGG